MSDRAFLGSLTNQLKALRLPEEDSIILSFEVERDEECEPDSDSAIRVGVRIGNVVGNSAAIHLQDAIALARADVRRKVEAEQRRRKESKARGIGPASYVEEGL